MIARSDPAAEAAYTIPPGKLWLYPALVAAWLLPGLIGHDPWKPDEAYTFGLVHSLLQGGSWLVPTLAGEPFLESPPLLHLAAALFAKALAWLLAPHDAARLAAGLFAALAAAGLGLAARELLGRTQGWIAVVILIGCVGLLLRAHLLVSETALLAGLGLGLYGLALAPRRPLAGGLALAAGAGVGFLGHGLLAPAALFLAAFLLPAAFGNWRTRRHAVFCAVALAAALPLLLVWPLLLQQQAPGLFRGWFAAQVAGRLPGLSSAAWGAQALYALKTLAWSSWPAWPIALWTLWHERGRTLASPACQLALASFAALFLMVIFVPNAGEADVLPLIVPLALLAAVGLPQLRRGAAAALDWFGIMTFGLFAALVWLGWLALLTGTPAYFIRQSRYFRESAPIEFRPLAVLVAAVVTLAWIAFVWRIGRGNRRAVINWAAGMALVWSLGMTLWLPWLDGIKSYRGTLLALRQQLPAAPGCVASRGLGESHRAMLHYHGGLVTQRLEAKPKAACDWLVVQGRPGREAAPGPGWKKVWEGGRPLDRSERFRLYRREG